MVDWTGSDDAGPRTYAELAERREQLVKLCERLGLDPAETVGVRVDVEPDGVLVSWDGRRKLTGRAAAQLVAGLVAGFPDEPASAVCGLHDRPQPCIECGRDDPAWSSDPDRP